MSDNHPDWAIAWDIGIKAAALVGAVFVYFTHGCEFNRINSHVTRLEGQLSEAQTELSRATIALTEAQTKQTSSELAARVVVTADIDQPILEGPLSEINLQLVASNIGNESATIDSVEVEVYRGDMTEAAIDVVKRARTLLEIERQNPWSHPENEQLIQEYNKLHEDCPHGHLFLVGDDSDDISWKRYVTLRGQSNHVLPPGQAARADFVLMSTHFYSHPIWLRAVPYVTIDNERRGFGEVLIAIRPNSVERQFTVAKEVKEVVETRDSVPRLPIEQEVIWPEQQ